MYIMENFGNSIAISEVYKQKSILSDPVTLIFDLRSL